MIALRDSSSLKYLKSLEYNVRTFQTNHCFQIALIFCQKICRIQNFCMDCQSQKVVMFHFQVYSIERQIQLKQFQFLCTQQKSHNNFPLKSEKMRKFERAKLWHSSRVTGSNIQCIKLYYVHSRCIAIVHVLWTQDNVLWPLDNVPWHVLWP